MFTGGLAVDLENQLTQQEFQIQNVGSNTMNISSTNSADVKFFDVQGILKTNVSIASGTSQIDVSGLEKGLYIISVQTEKGMRKERVIVE